jgi:hypothetical protein
MGSPASTRCVQGQGATRGGSGGGGGGLRAVREGTRLRAPVQPATTPPPAPGPIQDPDLGRRFPGGNPWGRPGAAFPTPAPARRIPRAARHTTRTPARRGRRPIARPPLPRVPHRGQHAVGPGGGPRRQWAGFPVGSAAGAAGSRRPADRIAPGCQWRPQQRLPRWPARRVHHCMQPGPAGGGRARRCGARLAPAAAARAAPAAAAAPRRAGARVGCARRPPGRAAGAAGAAGRRAGGPAQIWRTLWPQRPPRPAHAPAAPHPRSRSFPRRSAPRPAPLTTASRPCPRPRSEKAAQARSPRHAAHGAAQQGPHGGGHAAAAQGGGRGLVGVGRESRGRERGQRRAAEAGALHRRLALAARRARAGPAAGAHLDRSLPLPAHARTRPCRCTSPTRGSMWRRSPRCGGLPDWRTGLLRARVCRLESALQRLVGVARKGWRLPGAPPAAAASAPPACSPSRPRSAAPPPGLPDPRPGGVVPARL